MAYKDSSGRITIDEVAAQQDRSRIQRAIGSLENSRRAIETIINQASNESGQTANAIVDKAIELKNQINTMIARLNDTDSFIGNTVAHYKEVDRLVKEAILNASNSVANTTSKPVSVPTSQPTQPSAPKKSTSSKSSSSKKSSSKKSNSGGFIDDVFDGVADAFKKFF